MIIGDGVWLLFNDLLAKQTMLVALITALLAVRLFSFYVVSLLYKSNKN